MAYRIGKFYNARHVVGTDMDPVCGESDTTITTVGIKFPYKKEYSSFLEAAVAMDKITRKGEFVIIKVNA